MPYLHGIAVKENPTNIPAPQMSQAGVPVVFGTAPINLVSDPAAMANKLVLCNTFAEAKEKLGYSEDYSKFTLCQAMDAFFKVFTVGPVVFCNVLDVSNASHKEAITTTSVTVTNNQGKIAEQGVILATLVLKNGETAMVLGTDYTLAFDEAGEVVITVITSGITTITVESGSKIKPAGVQATDIIGTVDTTTDKYTGIQLVDKVYPELSVVPLLLLAPGWSHMSNVGLALALKCEGISGLFRAECVVDISSATGGATKYTDVATQKTTLGYSDEHMVCCWPMVKWNNKVIYFSAFYAAMTCRMDSDNDNVPNISPSNKDLKIAAAVLADGTEVYLDQPQANELNGVGVVTALNLRGWRSWGNNTAAYPAVTDPKDRWIACRRFFTWWGNSFITTYMEKVDSPANYRLIESIVDNENVRANALVSMGKCAGLRMEYRKEDNTIDKILDGKIYFRQHLAPYVPAEYIQCTLEFEPDMLEAALGGE